MTTKFHKLHIVEKRPWPISASVRALIIVTSRLLWINKLSRVLTTAAITATIAIAYAWWRDVDRESIKQGEHHKEVIKGLKTGILLFIASEVLFFLSFFWAFFHRSISPRAEVGILWPPKGITPFDPLNIPLLNTILLLSSGVTVTWSHHRIIKGILKERKDSLVTTIILGIVFTALQAFEYKEAPFSIRDSAFGSTFFIATGFHGLHVIIGSTFLTVSLRRLNKIRNSSQHIIGFECAAWYWHFVDVVWLFLYLSIYWWGAYPNSINVQLASNKPEKGNKNINNNNNNNNSANPAEHNYRKNQKKTKKRQDKKKAIRMRLSIINTHPIPILNSILPSNHSIYHLRRRNQDDSPPPHRNKNTKKNSSNNNIFDSPHNRTSIRMKKRKIRMGKIGRKRLFLQKDKKELLNCNSKTKCKEFKPLKDKTIEWKKGR
jgi:cytochrome c oxidase subunit 3